MTENRLPLEEPLGDAVRVYLSRLAAFTKTVVYAFVICSIPVIVTVAVRRFSNTSIPDWLSFTSIAATLAVALTSLYYSRRVKREMEEIENLEFARSLLLYARHLPKWWTVGRLPNEQPATKQQSPQIRSESHISQVETGFLRKRYFLVVRERLLIEHSPITDFVERRLPLAHMLDEAELAKVIASLTNTESPIEDEGGTERVPQQT